MATSLLMAAVIVPALSVLVPTHPAAAVTSEPVPIPVRLVSASDPSLGIDRPEKSTCGQTFHWSDACPFRLKPEVGSNPDGTIVRSDSTHHPMFSMTVSPDGTFKLTHGLLGRCLTVDTPGNVYDATSCDRGTVFNLQPDMNGSSDLIIRAPGNKCLRQSAELGRADYSDVVFGDCGNGTDKKMQWRIYVRNDYMNVTPREFVRYSKGLSKPVHPNWPILTKALAQTLGTNRVRFCNNGGFEARATIDYRIETASGPVEGRRATGTLRLGQCQSYELPAGQLTATVGLRRYTWGSGATDTGALSYDTTFHDTGVSSRNSGYNDRVAGIWTVGGIHADLTFGIQGTICSPSVHANQAANSQMAVELAGDRVDCGDTWTDPNRGSREWWQPLADQGANGVVRILNTLLAYVIFAILL